MLFAPPLILTTSQADEIVSGVKKAILTALAEGV